MRKALAFLARLAGVLPADGAAAPAGAVGRVLVVGCPNVGKSMLFNRLTGRNVTVSNYPGTTVEMARGSLQTPRGVYEALRLLDTDWRAWQVWFGDERCLAADDPQRNSRMAAAALLDHVPVPPDAVRVIRGELGAERAAAAYRAELAGVPEFDLVLLGLGEDGHTASLFPGGEWGEAPDAPDVLAVHAAPKPPAERVSLSARRLGRTRSVLCLVAGAEKRAAVAAWRAGVRLPAAAVRPPAGVDVLAENICIEG